MGDPGDMIGFYVSCHVFEHPLLSANVTGGHFPSSISVTHITFGDHGFDLFIKIMEFYICRCVCNQFVVLAFGVLGVRCVLC